MTEGLRQRLVDYINTTESHMCDEWCTGDWPKCDDEEKHVEACALLSELGSSPHLAPWQVRS